jgi:tRNA threonylcarbamoyladenosine biosynthesis protein TsaE
MGMAFGKHLKRGDAVFIFGEIGAGKTVFVTGVAAALGIREYITSPTFAIANIYEGSLTMCHYDAFRIGSPAELIEAGFYEYIGGDCLVIIEWAERLCGYEPDNCIKVRIEYVNGSDNERLINIV